MQRARLFTAWDGAWALPSLRQRSALAVPGLLLLLLLGAAWWILLHPKPPVWDQARLLEARFEAPYHPAPPYGFTVQLLVIGLKALLPSGAPLHEALRVVAMAFWAGAACWLGLALLERRGLVAVLLLLLFSSQYPFLWLSSELVAGGFLCLCLAAFARGAAPGPLGALLALLALCKPELLLVALVLLACFASARRPQAGRLAAGFAGTLGLLLLPGLLRFGPGYPFDYGAGGTGRGFAAFGQHFAALLAPLQLGPAPDPWNHPTPYLERVFPGARSMRDVILAPGLPYLDFVALSLARGVRRVGWLFQWAWPAAALLWLARRRAGLAFDERERALLWSFVGCLPFVLFAYPHVRYFARYYPVFWVLVLVAVERLAKAPAGRLRNASLALAGLCIALAFATNVERAAVGLALAPQLAQYWFPD